MARMQNFSVSGASANGAVTYTFTLRVTETSVDAENNASNVSVQVILKQDYNGVAFTDQTTNYSCSINDEQVFSVSKLHSLTGTSEHIYHTWNGILEHNYDGTLRIKVNGSLSVDNPTEDMPQSLTISGNDTMVLTPIVRFTPCSTPKNFGSAESHRLFEKYVDLIWDKASGGRNNPVTGYIIRATISNDQQNPLSGRVVWTGSESTVRITETMLLESGLRTQPGDRIWFWIRATGEAGEAYYSDWSEFYVSVNYPPNAPASATVAPTTVRKSERVTLSWEPAFIPDEDGGKPNYLIEYSEDNEKWYQLTTVNGDYREYWFAPREVDAIQYMYLRVSAVDFLGAMSEPVFAGRVQQLDVDKNATASIYDGGWKKYAPLINADGSSSRYRLRVYLDGNWGRYR